jgi:hypothetical protein
MFEFLMESVVVSFSLGAVVGVVIAPHLKRFDGQAYGPKRHDADSALVKVRIRRD